MKNKIYKLILLTLIGLGPITVSAQNTWTKTYGANNDDEGNVVQQTFDGSYIITGNTFPNQPWDSDLYLIKTNNFGDTVWTKTYGGAGNEIGVDVKQTTDNGYIIVGYNATMESGGFDVWLLKTNSSGDTLWTKKFGGPNNDFGNSVFQTDDGGYVIIGSTVSFGAGFSDFWIIRTNTVGDSLWSQTYGGIYNDIAFEAQATSDGGYIIAGYTQLQGFNDVNVWLLKLFSNGEIEWSQTYGGSLAGIANSVQETADAGYIVTGGGPDLFLIKTDMYGDTLWTKTFGGDRNDAGYSVTETAEGDFLVCGTTSSFSADGDFDLWLIKTDISGYTLWTKTYGETGAEIGFSIIETFDGRITVCGFTSSFGAGKIDVWLLHLDANGQVGIADHLSTKPKGYRLGQNFPNPFSGETTIYYSIPTSGTVSLEVFDLSGKLITTLVHEYKHAGSYSVRFENKQLPNGIYYYRLLSGNFNCAKQLILSR
ncbi:MAG: T9SS type A sorting domain-containing protein [Bacteroidales bacterium]|nr:T9SS type A sorting domain-containing protein [Bacteroidales bacterium]